MKPELTILIGSYNNAEYICRTLDSVLAQTYTNFRAIISDDGSGQEIHKLIEPYLEDSRFEFHSWNPNRGCHTNCLFGLTQVDTEFWTWIATDDILHRDCLQRRLAIMKSHPLAGMVYGNVNTIDSGGRTTERSVYRHLVRQVTSGNEMLGLLLQHNVIPAMGIICRTSVTRLVLADFLPDWKYTQDWYLWILMASTGFDFVYDEVPAVDYRVHANSINNSPVKAGAHFTKQYEIRLTPLWALHQASKHSRTARLLYQKWGRLLYLLWLPSGLRMYLTGRLTKAELASNMTCLYGNRHMAVPLVRAFLSLPLALAAWVLEKRKRKTLNHPVCGLALINHEIFI